MSRLIQPALLPRRGLHDPRSTGAASPLLKPDVLALRGTFKSR